MLKKFVSETGKIGTSGCHSCCLHIKRYPKHQQDFLLFNSCTLTQSEVLLMSYMSPGKQQKSQVQ